MAGHAPHGNFHRYYNFNPVEERLSRLRDAFNTDNAALDPLSSPLAVLDVGCNQGDLTVRLHDFLNERCPGGVRTLGVDLDTVLIQRAAELHSRADEVSFEALDVMVDSAMATMTAFLRKLGKDRFDLVTCFSITMWIHLNYGDDGLFKFLRRVASLARNLIIEPQPWSCYRSAQQRHRKLGLPPHPLFSALSVRTDVEPRIIEFVTKECGMTKHLVLGETKWKRTLIWYKHST
eukprot:TRINITY_DN4437_c0_g2_i2.p1 TRINITY_DN4437_c0_g2~~TRINITY_DN4437_c0_g2_i2.p1  ORF type:complete len:234 (+),score=71.82 TRINITY_DN4437_c0_g2_i2:87-788(+)